MTDRRIFYFKGGQVNSKVLPNLNDLTDVDDPSVWFDSGKKPLLTIKRQNVNDADFDTALAKHISTVGDTEIDINIVNLFLYKAGKELFNGDIETPWKLSNKVILPAGKVNLFDLVEVKEEGTLNAADFTTDEIPVVENKIELITILLSNYRINSLNKNALPQYKTAIKTNMNLTFKASKMISEEIPENVYLYTSWVNDTNFRKICSAFDMFLKKFPKDVHNPLRMCVQGSRYKDCSLLTDIMFGKMILGTDELGLFSLAIDSSVNKELIKYLDYITDDATKDGYFPYLKEFNVITKSPYSASHSPNSHNWIHMIGVLLGETRSINSRLAPNGQNPQVFNLAISCGFLLRNRSAISPAFASSEAELNSLTETSRAVQDISLNPRAVMNNINALISDTGEGEDIREWASSRVRMLQNLREGSIGKYLQDQLVLLK